MCPKERLIGLKSISRAAPNAVTPASAAPDVGWCRSADLLSIVRACQCSQSGIFHMRKLTSYMQG